MPRLTPSDESPFNPANQYPYVNRPYPLDAKRAA